MTTKLALLLASGGTGVGTSVGYYVLQRPKTTIQVSEDVKKTSNRYFSLVTDVLMPFKKTLIGQNIALSGRSPRIYSQTDYDRELRSIEDLTKDPHFFSTLLVRPVNGDDMSIFTKELANWHFNGESKKWERNPQENK